MKIFITGGAGFIGSNFIRHILSLNKGYKIVNYDKLTYAGNLANLESVADHPDYSFVRGSICDANTVEDAMGGCDAVMHFAAESHVDRSIYEPAPVIDTNVTGTFVMLQVARKLNIERFVHISTDEVYGDMAPGAFADESSPLQPSTSSAFESCGPVGSLAGLLLSWPAVEIPGRNSSRPSSPCRILGKGLGVTPPT